MKERITISDNIKIASERHSKINNGVVLSDNHEGKNNLFLGIGLLSNRKISSGLNPAILGMAILARQIQMDNSKIGVNSQIIALIADAHAIASMNAKQWEKNKISETTNQVVPLLNSLLNLLGSENNRVIKSSLIQHESPNQTNSYESMQTETMSIAVKNWNIIGKIGWSTKRKPLNGVIIRDESYFDRYFEKNVSPELRGKLSYIYGIEGLSLSSSIGNQMTNLPPYFSEELNNSLGYITDISRVIKRVSNKVSTEAGKQLENYYKEIDKSLNKLLGITSAKHLETVNLLRNSKKSSCVLDWGVDLFKSVKDGSSKDQLILT